MEHDTMECAPRVEEAGRVRRLGGAISSSYSSVLWLLKNGQLQKDGYCGAYLTQEFGTNTFKSSLIEQDPSFKSKELHKESISNVSRYEAQGHTPVLGPDQAAPR
ncbi:unnamed protein product [Dovyalis caffra]|uniref:Uncharacterized protein n=1 Tax=Dovyalis caffra TaxID=77055 RepID=A0AAV1SGN8_9ROSI|nr:unnamed protein product [Dovyalis caffra]